jgi:hydroxypyruvate reductase
LLHHVPLPARKHLLAGMRGAREETLKPRDPESRRTSTRIVGDNRTAVAAAAREAERLGFLTRTLTTRLDGEARHAGPRLVSELAAFQPRRKAGVCLLASGETTVTVSGHGRGGRNQELVVASVRGLARIGVPAVVASLASDGIDGRSDAGGGVADDRTLARARRAGLAPPESFLLANDTTGFLAPLSDLILTGPTGTNLLDLTVLLR